MDTFEGSTLWRISAFRHAREAGQTGIFAGDRPTLLPTTLMDQAKEQKALLFNPLALTASVEPLADPVLLIRPAAYGVSYGQRAQ